MNIRENLKQLTRSSDDIIEKVLYDRQIRRGVASQDILWFFGLYFANYIKYKTADFQIEILGLLQDDENKRIFITGFRDCGKSTFCSLVLPIWSMITHQKKYILIVCQTEERAQQVLRNIRSELEAPGMLVDDFGAFCENDEWNKNTLVIPKYGARIMAVSVSETIRGVRHREHKPDLVICDDIEDVQSSRVKESRDKLWKFVNSELIPTGDKNARYIFTGNLVHQDSVMMRFKKAVGEDRMDGIYREYPLVDGNGSIAWPGKYPSLKEIERLKRRQASEIDYLREYCLLIIPEGDQIIFPEDIIRYDENEMNSRNDFRLYLIAIDPAVSLRHTADKTAIIVAKVYGYGDKFKIYIQKYPVNKRLTFPEIIDEVKRIVSSFGKNLTYKIFVEGGSVQKGLAQLLQKEELHAEEVNVQGQDKRTRLSMTRYLLQKWVSLPKIGTEELEIQMLGFDVERYDDLVDALTLLVIQAVNNYKSKGVGSFSMISDPEPIYRKIGGDWVDVTKPITAGLLDKKF